jgi:acyl carrier protein
MDELVETVIYNGLSAINEERPRGDKIPLEPDAALFGSDSLLDSLDLINLLTSVEMGLAEIGYDINLADDEAVVAEPWTTVEALREYILRQMA